MRRTLRTRAIGLLVLVLSLAAVLVGLKLTPDPRGYGTHEQLGSAPCGFLLVTGYPCPTCGMTTAFCHAVRGRWLAAVRVQPAGFVFALATALAGILGACALLVGRWPGWVFRWLNSPWLFVGLLTVLLGGWASKLALGLIDGTLPVR